MVALPLAFISKDKYKKMKIILNGSYVVLSIDAVDLLDEFLNSSTVKITIMIMAMVVIVMMFYKDGGSD